MAPLQVSGSGPSQCVELVLPPTQRKGSGATSPKTTPPQVTPPQPTSPHAATAATQESPCKPLGQKGTPKKKPPKKQDEKRGAATADTVTSLVPLHFDEKEAKRLCSESQRLLLSHPDHAMTLAEMVESFMQGEDPARPSTGELHHCLAANNTTGSGGEGVKVQQKYQVGIN